MINYELLNNYYNSIKQKYNAVCFDIDGTLTESNSSRIDKRAIEIISKLLKNHIPILFITGRGETGLDEIKNELMDSLRFEFGVDQQLLKKMYAITNDGARIFLTSNGADSLFNVNEYIASPIDLDKLKKLSDDLINQLYLNDLLKYCKVTYSRDRSNNKILNTRVSLLTDDSKINNKIIEIINELINNSNSENINLTFGKFRGNNILQIGTTIKGNAINVAEKIIGIPQDSMLRIGDCGDELGNDYTMLNCTQGFSVDKRSNVNNKCFPVIDENLNILTGIEATLFLLKQLKLIPTICLEHAREEDYAKAYSNVERQMNFGKNKRIAIFNELINNKYELVDGIYGLYDKSSGSIKIPMFEWICIDDNNPLKKLWNKSNQISRFYSMYDNESVLLRGSKIYYYFLAMRNHNEQNGDDITTIEMVNEWLDNNIDFYNESIIALQKINKIDKLTDEKMLLGILDNVRNEMLVLLNNEIINVSKSQNLMINLEKNNNQTMKKIYQLLVKTSDIMGNISFNINYNININEIINVLTIASLITNKFKLKFNKGEVKDNYSKDFRVYREIDSFAENFITCYLTIKNDKNFSDKGICGLSYGGIELPIIMKSIDNRLCDVSILKFNKNVTGYSKKQSLSLRFFDIEKLGGIKQIGIDKKKNYILVDDNLLTGKTMQLALTTLYDMGINTDKIIVVRYPGVNRISQMFMPNHGAVDYRCFFDFIQGLYFPSPYSWRDPNSIDPYEDSLGIFDLNRRKILECLAKNGDYSKNSEVKYVKRMVRSESN